MADKRKDDCTDTTYWHRADRIFEIEGSWFFYTREGDIEGPFASEVGALHRINVYIQIVSPELRIPALGFVPGPLKF
jgi:hypothetical protein